MSEQDKETVPGSVLSKDNPWPGLNSFDEGSAEFFFGRAQETAELERLVRRELLSVVFGKSGSGKSSLLRAGLFPMMRPRGFAPVYIRLHHDETSLTLTGQVLAEVKRVIENSNGRIEARLPEADESLWEYFHRSDVDWWDEKNHFLIPILIFDQFEEVLTIGRRGEYRIARTEAFFTNLEDLVECHVPEHLQERLKEDPAWRVEFGRRFDLKKTNFRVILVLREDFLAELEALRERLRGVMQNRYRLLPMHGEQAFEVVTKPVPGLVSEEVALKIIRRVTVSERSQSQPALTRAQLKNQQVEPALLSLFCAELNLRRKAKTELYQIDESLVEGASAEILGDFYERAFKDMPEQVREFIEDKLLTIGGARNLFPLDDACLYPEVTPDAIQRLIDRRLIRKVPSTSVVWIELVHDILADFARTSKRSREERRRLAAEQKSVQEELDRATARIAEEKGKRKRLLRIMVGIGALGLLALIAMAFALYFRNEALKKESKLAESKAAQNDLLYMIENNVAEDARKLGQNTLMAEVNERVLSYLKDHRPEADDEGALQMESLALEQNGDVLVARGRFVDAKQSYQDSLDISDRLLALTRKRNDAEWQRDRQQDRAKSIDGLGEVSAAQGVYSDALERYREARDIRENLVRSNPEISAPANFQLQVDLASSLEHLGDLFMQKEDYNKAEESFGAAANIRKTLDSSRKGNERQQQAVKLALSSSLDKLGNVCNAHRKYSDALAFYLESFSLRRSLVTREPQNLEFQEMLAYSFFHIGDVSREQQHVVEALTNFVDYAQILQLLANRDPGNPERQYNLALGLESLGAIREMLGQLSEARDSFTTAVGIAEDLLKNDQQDPRWQDALATFLERRGDAFEKLENLDETRKCFAKSFEIRSRRAQQKPDDIGLQRDLSSSFDRLGNIDQAQKRMDDALSNYRQSLEIRRRFADQGNTDVSWQDCLAFSYEHIGDVYYAQASLSKALDAYRQAGTIRQSLFDLDRENPSNKGHLARLSWRLALALDKSQVDAREEARRLVKQGLNLMDYLFKNCELSAIQRKVRTGLEGLANDLEAPTANNDSALKSFREIHGAEVY